MKVCDMYYSIVNTPEWGEKTEKIIKSYDMTLKKIKSIDKDMYKSIKKNLYIDLNGPHFNKMMLEEALGKMINDNGTKAPKWTIEETSMVAKQNGITFDIFNEYDWNYTMNMFYSDYCKVLNESVSNYINMSKKFLEDSDGPKGKALLYYFAMC